jgi:O-acetylhomoserine (thiol)-lyase
MDMKAKPVRRTRSWSNPDTAVLHAGYRSDPATSAVCVPIYQSTAYELSGDLSEIADIYNVKADGFTYTRIINPTTRVLEKRFAATTQGVDALALASGQAATFTCLMNLASGRPGDNVIASPYLYGNTWNLLHNTLRRMGIEARVGNPADPSSFEALIDDRTICLFGETVSNPICALLPVRELAQIGNRYGVPLVVDNTTTPLVCNPGKLGAALTTYSATKYVCGHGTTLGGLIVDHDVFPFESHGRRFPLLCGPDEAHGNILWHEAVKDLDDLGASAVLLKARMTWLRDTGGCASPFNSFQLIQGLETLPLRMRRHSETAGCVAEMLAGHPKVERVIYPSRFQGRQRELASELFDPRFGHGAMVMFDVAGGAQAGRRLIENVRLMYHVSNVGDARTLITHPVSTTHTTAPREKREAAGIHDGSIRLCVGLEHVDDIIKDLSDALIAV